MWVPVHYAPATNDASCAQAAGLWDNGQPIYGPSSVSANEWGGGPGGGLGDGPLSGDYGVGLPPPGGAGGPPCDFGTCAGPTTNPYTTNPVAAPAGSSYDYVMQTFVAWPFLPNATPSRWRRIGWGSNGFYFVLPYSNYCGPGNTGYGSPALNGVDAACMGHDLRYDAVGINFLNWAHLVPMTPMQQAGKAADQQLCTDLAGTIFDTPAESANLFYVQSIFHCH